MTSSDVKTEALREQIRQIRRELAPGVDLKPASAYEAVTRQMVDTLGEELREIKERLNGLLWMVAATILAEVISRLMAIR